jgi:hypothetical protein
MPTNSEVHVCSAPPSPGPRRSAIAGAGRIPPSVPLRPGRSPIVYWPIVGGAAVLTLTLVFAATAWVLNQPQPAAAQSTEPSARAAAPILALAMPPAPRQEPLAITTPTGDPPGPPKTSPPASPALVDPTKEIQVPAPAVCAVNENGPACAETQSYGTSVAFLNTPAEAAAKAQRDRKLLFLLHVAGNFEDSRFT